MITADDVLGKIQEALAEPTRIWNEITYVSGHGEPDGDTIELRWRYLKLPEIFGKRFSLAQIRRDYPTDDVSILATAVISNEVAGPPGEGTLRGDTEWLDDDH